MAEKQTRRGELDAVWIYSGEAPSFAEWAICVGAWENGGILCVCLNVVLHPAALTNNNGEAGRKTVHRQKDHGAAVGSLKRKATTAAGVVGLGNKGFRAKATTQAKQRQRQRGAEGAADAKHR